MTEVDKDLGVAIVLLEAFAQDTLPKALEIKARMDRGEKLDHWDIEFLHDLLRRTEHVKPLIDAHPEYQQVYAQAVHLYKQITDEALINEHSN